MTNLPRARLLWLTHFIWNNFSSTSKYQSAKSSATYHACQIFVMIVVFTFFCFLKVAWLSLYWLVLPFFASILLVLLLISNFIWVRLIINGSHLQVLLLVIVSHSHWFYSSSIDLFKNVYFCMYLLFHVIKFTWMHLYI